MGRIVPFPPPPSPPPPAASRRPADVWVPRRVSGFAEAWDFSVSSLLRSSHLSSASPSVADVFHEVETQKRAFQDTASLVAERGSQAFRGVVAWIASESRTARGLATDSPKDTGLRIAQRFSCTVHRENARAILRRSPGSVNGSSGMAGDQVPTSGFGLHEAQAALHVLIHFVHKHPGCGRCGPFTVTKNGLTWMAWIKLSSEASVDSLCAASTSVVAL